MSPLREKGVSKKGYLTKAPFHGENNGTPGAKVKFASCQGGGGGVLPYISYILIVFTYVIIFIPIRHKRGKFICIYDFTAQYLTSLGNPHILNFRVMAFRETKLRSHLTKNIIPI